MQAGCRRVPLNGCRTPHPAQSCKTKASKVMLQIPMLPTLMLPKPIQPKPNLPKTVTPSKSCQCQSCQSQFCQSAYNTSYGAIALSVTPWLPPSPLQSSLHACTAMSSFRSHVPQLVYCSITLGSFPVPQCAHVVVCMGTYTPCDPSSLEVYSSSLVQGTVSNMLEDLKAINTGFHRVTDFLLMANT